jgi:RimJ/RimL family protein N-acetyltransferase
VDNYQLSDGRTVAIRRISPDDDERLRDSHARLSPQSRYRRFMSAKPQLSSSDARYLVDVDGDNHFALVATSAQGEGERIVGVARFIRVPEQPQTAEFAIVISDGWQRQGLGRELLRRLVDAAPRRGVQRFRATMLADNAAIHRLIEDFAGDEVRHRRAGTTCEAEFSVRPQHAGAVAAPGTDAEAPPGDDGSPADEIIAAWAGS